MKRVQQACAQAPKAPGDFQGPLVGDDRAWHVSVNAWQSREIRMGCTPPAPQHRVVLWLLNRALAQMLRAVFLPGGRQTTAWAVSVAARCVHRGVPARPGRAGRQSGQRIENARIRAKARVVCGRRFDFMADRWASVS